MTPTPVYPDPRLVDLIRSMMGGTMPPWESYRWFDTPAETTYGGGGPAGTERIAARDVRRVVLAIYPGGNGASVAVSLRPGSDPARGITVSQQAPLILTHQQHAILCQEEWWTVGGTQTATVIEVRLRAWPGGDPVG